MKKILHITNWYPHKWNDLEALFIKEQFNLFSEVSNSKLLHIEVRNEENHFFKFKKVKYSENETGYYILSKIKTHRVIEVITTFLLLWVLYKEKAKTYDLLHFHIAYPLLTYYKYWKNLFKLPVLLSEHWSAYHYNFFMPKETKKLDKIKNIFHQNIPLITVSKALLTDIQNFAGNKNFKSYIIPNVIDLKEYDYKTNPQNIIPTFFIVNFWRNIKNPYPMLEAFSNLSKAGIDFKLNIGGYGIILDDMKNFVKKHNLDDKVEFLGRMYKEEISKEMNKSDAYLFSSNYETFSVVCAQALCCGCPLIGPKLDAIREYASDDEMIGLKENSITEWEFSIKQFLSEKEKFDRKTISKKIREYLSYEKIKEDYLNIIGEIVE